MEEWRSMTVIGSIYEEEIEIHSNRFRHRKMTFHINDKIPNFVEPWKTGRAPTIKEQWRIINEDMS